jgi:hypothetical protein
MVCYVWRVSWFIVGGGMCTLIKGTQLNSKRTPQSTTLGYLGGVGC